MRKLVSIFDIYTDNFFNERILFVNNPFIEYARELIEQPEMPIQETKYYGWLLDHLQRYGKVWSYIDSIEKVEQRVLKYKKLIRTIKVNGWKDELSPRLFICNNKIYGDATAEEFEEGKYLLWDGHHRLSAMYVMGYTRVPLTICTLGLIGTL